MNPAAKVLWTLEEPQNEKGDSSEQKKKAKRNVRKGDISVVIGKARKRIIKRALNFQKGAGVRGTGRT